MIEILYSKIGSEDDMHILKGKVMRFLEENEVDIDRFFEMHGNKRKVYTVDNIIDLVSDTRYEMFVSMESWSNSPEGVEYWSGISDNWEVLFDELLKDHKKVIDSGADVEPKRMIFKSGNRVSRRSVL